MGQVKVLESKSCFAGAVRTCYDGGVWSGHLCYGGLVPVFRGHGLTSDKTLAPLVLCDR